MSFEVACFAHIGVCTPSNYRRIHLYISFFENKKSKRENCSRRVSFSDYYVFYLHVSISLFFLADCFISLRCGLLFEFHSFSLKTAFTLRIVIQ